MKRRLEYMIMLLLILFFVFMFWEQSVIETKAENENIEYSTVLRYLRNKNKIKMSNHINMEDDSSIYKYVNANNPLNNIKYEPANLLKVSIEYVETNNRTMLLRPEANNALYDLSKAFWEEFDKKIYLVSAYRPYASQKRLIDQGCPPSKCAKPGTSEHQLGLAIDIHVANERGLYLSMGNKDNIYYRRLEQNAHRYGWHNTFQKGIHIDGQMEEGWHRRYLGVDLATKLWKQDMTFGEYYNSKK